MSTVAKRWSVDDIEFDNVEIDRVAKDEALFFVIASSSFVESGSDLYTSTLIDFFGESEAAQWLREHWEGEEMNHGRVLRRYVEKVWPDFQWEKAFNEFMDEYSLLCTRSQLEASPTLELAARCVVETGTAALYGALHEYTTEPVLKKITGLIRNDEIRHYKNFNRFFKLYNQRSRYGKWPVFQALRRRLLEIRNEDAECALHHVFSAAYENNTWGRGHFFNISKNARGLVVKNMPADMMVKMFLQPLQLPVSVRRLVHAPCSKMIKTWMRR